MDKKMIASDLRSAIEHYTECTVNEHLLERINPESDEAWNHIKELINKLVEG